MIIDASHDVSMLALAYYYWPWGVVLALALVNFITIFIMRRRRTSQMWARLPIFTYDEKEDGYYYEYPGEPTAWVRDGEPQLPGYYYYDEEKGRFFYNDGEQEPVWIEPENIGWDTNAGRSAIGCWPLIILVVGSIFALIFDGDVQDGMPDPRGLRHELEILTIGLDENDQVEIERDVVSYRPGDRFMTAGGESIALPVFPQPEFSDGTPDYGTVPMLWINNSDRLIQYNRYQYETTAYMCGGGGDGQLVFVLLPFLVMLEAPGYQGYSGPAGQPPGGVDSYSYAGCTTILYLGIGAEPYDPETDTIPPEYAAEVNAEWWARQAADRAEMQEAMAEDFPEESTDEDDS